MDAHSTFLSAAALIYLPALLGHFMLWVGIYNRLHGTSFSRLVIYAFEKLIDLALVAIPGIFGWLLLVAFRSGIPLPIPTQVLLTAYTGGCWITLLVGIPRWLQLRRVNGRGSALIHDSSRRIQVDKRLGDRPVGNLRTWWTVRIPGNQVFDLELTQKRLSLPRLPQNLEGLTIAHLSDLHFSGRILPPYFDVVVDETNALEADLIMIAGDIVDKEACLPWIRSTLGRLRSRYGVYFVLGNHDQRVRSPERVRRAMVDCGFVDLGGRVTSICIRDAEILLAGNEAPWFLPLPDLDCLPARASTDFRILLSHTPDQIPWAREHRFDLMLAGHTHGGQIRIPILGPTVAPSRFGIKYASGTFVENPTTMHVSRGISGLQTVRFGCPPELSLLTLCRQEIPIADLSDNRYAFATRELTEEVR